MVGCNGHVDPGSSPGLVAADGHSAHAQELPSSFRSLLVDTDQWLLREARYSCERSLVQELRNSHLVTSTTRRTQSVISSVHCTKKHHRSCVEQKLRNDSRLLEGGSHILCFLAYSDTVSKGIPTSMRADSAYQREGHQTDVLQ